MLRLHEHLLAAEVAWTDIRDHNNMTVSPSFRSQKWMRFVGQACCGHYLNRDFFLGNSMSRPLRGKPLPKMYVKWPELNRSHHLCLSREDMVKI